MAGKYGDPIRPGARNFVALRHEIPSGPTGRPPNTGVNTDCTTGHPRSEFRGTTPRNSGGPNLTSSYSHEIRVRQRLRHEITKIGPNGSRRSPVKVVRPGRKLEEHVAELVGLTRPNRDDRAGSRRACLIYRVRIRHNNTCNHAE